MGADLGRATGTEQARHGEVQLGPRALRGCGDGNTVCGAYAGVKILPKCAAGDMVQVGRGGGGGVWGIKRAGHGEARLWPEPGEALAANAGAASWLAEPMLWEQDAKAHDEGRDAGGRSGNSSATRRACEPLLGAADWPLTSQTLRESGCRRARCERGVSTGTWLIVTSVISGGVGLKSMLFRVYGGGAGECGPFEVNGMQDRVFLTMRTAWQTVANRRGAHPPLRSVLSRRAWCPPCTCGVVSCKHKPPEEELRVPVAAAGRASVGCLYVVEWLSRSRSEVLEVRGLLTCSRSQALFPQGGRDKQIQRAACRLPLYD
jgi:hypothetical protein